jgi:molecular chaperone DnaK (HSP70)
MAKTVGIDLGTTYSLIAYQDKASGQPKCIPGPYGTPLCPSVVSVDADGSTLVGEPARRRLLTQSGRTIYSVKRLMGRGVADVQGELKLFPFRIESDSGNVIRVRLGESVLTPPEISAFILRELKQWAEHYFGDSVDRAVITVPAYFNDAQRQATKDAGRLAGLEVLRLVNEPTAAALAYGLHEQRRGKVAVYDFGGGTFDISILRLISTGEGDIYQVLSTNGDTHLGGDDLDNVLLAKAREEIRRERGIDLESHPEAVQELRKALIAAKHELSRADHAVVIFDPPGGSTWVREFTRKEFESWIRPILDRTMGPVKMALADAKLKPSEMDEVVLVGGSTRVPLVRGMVEEFFGRRPHAELNPDEVVALGAAVQADILESGVRNMLLLDVTPLSLGIETMGGVVAKIIPRNSTIPARAFPVARAARPGGSGPCRGQISDRREWHPASRRTRSQDGRAAIHRSSAQLRFGRCGNRAHARRIHRICRAGLHSAAVDRSAQRSGDGNRRHGEVTGARKLPRIARGRAARDRRVRGGVARSDGRDGLQTHSRATR